MSHVSSLEEARIRIWVQLATSLVVQLCTSHVLRQNCNFCNLLISNESTDSKQYRIGTKDERKKKNKPECAKPLPYQHPGNACPQQESLCPTGSSWVALPT